MKQQSCMAVVAVLLCSLTLPCSGLAETGRPNIVWISLEDITPMMGCYGDKYARTPVFDKFAAQGIRYTHAHSVAPVCSISRSIISGLYPTSLGTHHHRSNVGEPPAFVKMLPNLLTEAGYYTSNNAKQDYNIGGVRWHETSKKAHWRNRPDKEQPLRTQRAFSARHQGDHRPGDLLPLGTCCPSAKRRLRERNKHFEETGWFKHSIRHSHAAIGVPFSFKTVPATAPQACRLSRLELQLYRLDLSVSPIGEGEGDVRDTTFRIAGDPDRAVEEVASSSSLFVCYAPLDLRASFYHVGE